MDGPVGGSVVPGEEGGSTGLPSLHDGLETRRGRIRVRDRRERAVSGTVDAVTNARRLLSVTEAASYLGVSVWTVRTLGWNGEIPQVKIGRRVLYDRPDLDAFVERSKR